MAGQHGGVRPVLVVEDEESILFLVTYILERDGFRVIAARDFQDAQARIETMDAPSLVVLDLILPSGDGLDLLPTMRSKPGWETVPILALTTLTRKRDISRGLSRGLDAYLTKPFKVDELRARVRRLVGGAPASG